MRFLFILLSLALAAAASAKDKPRYKFIGKDAAALKQIKTVTPAGYLAETDQAFQLNFEGFEGEYLFFASADPGSGKSPLILVYGNQMFRNKDELSVSPGTNLVKVDAVSFTDLTGDGTTEVLAILTLEPLSGRSSDYWQRGFIFRTETNEGRLLEHPINKKLADNTSIKTIAALKAFYKKNMPVLSFAGNHVYKHEVVMYCPSEPDGCRAEAHDYLRIAPISKTEFVFSLFSTQGNGHVCGASGTAKFIEKQWRYNAAPEFKGDEPCRIVFDIQSDKIALNVPKQYSCRTYCGARAGIDGVAFPIAKK